MPEHAQTLSAKPLKLTPANPARDAPGTATLAQGDGFGARHLGGART
jgi:hypothetical protein